MDYGLNGNEINGKDSGERISYYAIWDQVELDATESRRYKKGIFGSINEDLNTAIEGRTNFIFNYDQIFDKKVTNTEIIECIKELFDNLNDEIKAYRLKFKNTCFYTEFKKELVDRHKRNFDNLMKKYARFLAKGNSSNESNSINSLNKENLGNKFKKFIDTGNFVIKNDISIQFDSVKSPSSNISLINDNEGVVGDLASAMKMNLVKACNFDNKDRVDKDDLSITNSLELVNNICIQFGKILKLCVDILCRCNKVNQNVDIIGDNESLDKKDTKASMKYKDFVSKDVWNKFSFYKRIMKRFKFLDYKQVMYKDAWAKFSLAEKNEFEVTKKNWRNLRAKELYLEKEKDWSKINNFFYYENRDKDGYLVDQEVEDQSIKENDFIKLLREELKKADREGKVSGYVVFNGKKRFSNGRAYFNIIDEMETEIIDSDFDGQSKDS